MDTTKTGEEDLYRAAVGEKKADFYLPKFLAFDQPEGSKVSWNWPAFFVSFFWFLYRRMYVNALVYFLALPIALVVAGVILMLVLGERVGSGLYVLLAVGVCWVVVPMFANALYHRHVRQRIDKVLGSAPSEEAAVQRLIGESSVAGAGLIIVIAIAAFIPVLGILAAIAIPAYQDYSIRAQVSEGLMLAAPIKDSVANAYRDSHTWPQGLAAADATEASGQFVEAVEVVDGTVVIRYGDRANRLIAGKMVTLRPVASGDDVAWSCGYAVSEDGEAAPHATDINPKYLPKACRQ